MKFINKYSSGGWFLFEGLRVGFSGVYETSDKAQVAFLEKNDSWIKITDKPDEAATLVTASKDEAVEPTKKG